MNLKYWLISLAVTLSVLSVIYGANNRSGNTAPHTREVLLRKIGHQLLLSAGDSSSRVMPIRKISNSEYQISFEHELALSHDSIISITKVVLAETNENFDVDVLSCAIRDIVYSFEIKKTGNKSLIPCGGRVLPRSCYLIHIKFDNTAPPSFIGYGLAGLGITAMLLAGIIFFKRRTPMQQQEPSILQGENVRIGQYIFNPSQHWLELNGTKTMLTQKESKILVILSSSINEVVPREVLQKEGWENEGVIVTRSLDMFISKLRKKLEPDPSVKIVNLPARGYKLEVLS